MRKYPIVKEFKLLNRPGILVMKEETNILTGKMMDINDIIRVTYSMTSDDISSPFIEDINKTSYDSYKQDAIKSFEIAKNQTDNEKENLTKWLIKLDSKHILREYLFNEIYTFNPHSVFKQMNNILPDNKIGDYCYEYIDKNILNRYKVKEILLWVQYFDLKQTKVPGSGIGLYNPTIELLQYNPKFTFHAIDDDDKKATIATKEYVDGTIDIGYQQDMSSKFYTFIYYYDIIFERA